MLKFIQGLGAGTIHNKLQGTVYDLDFDEDFNENVENLKSMRDRRRSIESRQHQPEAFRSRDASESPKFATANNQKLSRMVFGGTEIRDIRQPSASPNDANNLAVTQNIPSQANQPPMHIEPVMPGPVDMRTYTNSELISTDAAAQQQNKLKSNYEFQQQAFTKVPIGAFALTDQTLPDIDEELEKVFVSALKASNTKTQTNTSINEFNVNVQSGIVSNDISSRLTSHVVESIPMDPMSNLDNLDEPPKHSLIKLKIKGPHARPENYTSSVITTYQTHNTIEQTIQLNR